MAEIPFGFVRDGKIHRNAWGEHGEREIGEVREGDLAKSIIFFEEKFEAFVAKIQEVTTKIDTSENKGSYLMKLIHLKEQLPTHDGLGDYLSLNTKIEQYENLVKDIIQKNRTRNSEIKTALIAEASALEEIVNWKEATQKAHDLKVRWIKTGSAEVDKNAALEEEFWAKVTHFFDRKKQFFEDKQKLIEYRQRKYQELVAEAEKLSELRGKVRFEKVKSLKQEWSENGGIPSEQYQPLHEAFHKALKAGNKKHFPAFIDYNEIFEKLENVKSGTLPYNKQELDQLKKKIFKDRSKSEQKFKSLTFISLLFERDFVLKIANKRFPNFPAMDRDRKKGIKRGILKDLIQRDTEDLKIYEENSANFSTSDGSMNKLVEGKIKGQKKKIEVKTKLLEWIEAE